MKHFRSDCPASSVGVTILDMQRRDGFILFVSVAILPLILLVVFSFNTFSREEALRVHRIFWNDMLTKAAEGVGEEAFSWFLANPRNELAEFLADPTAAPGQEKSCDLLPHLRFSQHLQGPTVERCQFSIIKPQSYFRSSALPAGFNSVSSGYLFPDLTERFALLKIEVTVSYQRYRRKYEALREVKTVNILPGVFGQFTLFVKDKKPGQHGDMNQLKTETERLAPVLSMEGFADATTPLGNPLSLIHHPDDAVRTAPLPGSGKVSPDWAGGTFDPSRRGWVFLGSTLTTSPSKAWIFQPLQGDINLAAANPISFRYFGGTHLFSNHTVLVYHTKMPSLAALTPPVPPPTVNLSASPFSDDTGHPFVGWMVTLKRYGVISASQAVFDLIGIGHVFRSYYQDPDHAGESVHGSLILPFGSLYPSGPSTVADRRSPTILLGPAGLRLIQTGTIWQMDQTTDQAFLGGQDMVAAFENQSPGSKPNTAWLPFFPIQGNALMAGKPDTIGWNNYPVWAMVGEQGAGNAAAFPGRDWAAVNYNILDHVLGGGQTPPMMAYYGAVMSNVLLVHAMNACEHILSNNMRGVTNPAGWQVPQGSRLLNTLPPTLQPVDNGGNDTSDTADAFFFSDSGRGVSGNRLALKDTAGTRLAVGYLGALWPFSTGTATPNATLSFPDYDWRQKTTHLVRSPDEFRNVFLKTEGGVTTLDLAGGVVTVLGGDLLLKSPSGSIAVRGSGMLIVSAGTLTLEAGMSRDPGSPSPGLITLATARDGDNVILSTSRTIEAFIVSSGTLKKKVSGGISIVGGLMVKHLEFNPTDADSLFRGHPQTVDQRSSVIWNPAFNALDPANRLAGRRFHLGPVVSYWKSGVD